MHSSIHDTTRHRGLWYIITSLHHHYARDDFDTRCKCPINLCHHRHRWERGHDNCGKWLQWWRRLFASQSRQLGVLSGPGTEGYCYELCYG